MHNLWPRPHLNHLHLRHFSTPPANSRRLTFSFPSLSPPPPLRHRCLLLHSCSLFSSVFPPMTQSCCHVVVIQRGRISSRSASPCCLPPCPHGARSCGAAGCLKARDFSRTPAGVCLTFICMPRLPDIGAQLRLFQSRRRESPGC